MKYYRRIIEKLDLSLSSTGFDSCNEEFTSAEFDPSQLKGTPLYWDNNNVSVLHFTTIDAARLILENGYLRTSNMNRFEDKGELTVGADVIKSEFISNLTEMKSRSFACSFTIKGEDDVERNYDYHWKNYANNGVGVALEFEINELPSDVFPLRVNYVEKEKLFGDHSVPMLSVEESFLLPIFAAYKLEIDNNSDVGEYYKEEEVRLFYTMDAANIECCFDEGDKEIIRPEFDKDNGYQYFWRIPFAPKKDSKPYLKLKAIHWKPTSVVKEFTANQRGSGSLCVNTANEAISLIDEMFSRLSDEYDLEYKSQL